MLPKIDGVLPGVQITAKSIRNSGFTTALETLNHISLVDPGIGPLNGNNGGQTSSFGAAFGDLLGLSTAYALTLVNGQRSLSGSAALLFVAVSDLPGNELTIPIHTLRISG